MRFSGERQVPAAVGEVWASLHDPEVLRSVIPGCTDLVPRHDRTFAATLQARVGRIADTYRGGFSVTDVQAGSELRVRVQAAGRFGRMEVDLYVTLAQGAVAGSTALRYDAAAEVSGMVSRLGRSALTVAGNHFTGCFFRDLGRVLSRAEDRCRLVAS